MRPWRGVPIAATCENGRPNLPLRLLLRPSQQDSATVLSISPRILHDCARNLIRLGKPKQAHSYNKVNGDTEAGQQKDADEAGAMGESGCLQPPTSSRGADCADQLLAVRIPDHARETRHIGLKNHSISADPFRLPIAEA